MMNLEMHIMDNVLFHRLEKDPFELYKKYPNDSIPDTQKITMEMECEDKRIVSIDFDICAAEYRLKTERYYIFEGTCGKCKIDMVDHKISEYDKDNNHLRTIEYDYDKNDGHGGSDYYVMETFVNLMLDHKSHNCVSFNEAIRATYIGCLAEKSLENNGLDEYYIE
jgi:hypothetical protein